MCQLFLLSSCTGDRSAGILSVASSCKEEFAEWLYFYFGDCGLYHIWLEVVVSHLLPVCDRADSNAS